MFALRPLLFALLASSLLAACSASLRAQAPASSAAVPIGAVVEAPFTDLRWQTRRLPELGATKATVLFFASIECPLVQRYLPRVGELAKTYAERGVVVVVVNVGAGDAFVDAVGEVTTKAPAAVFARDFELALAHACGVDRTAAAVVLDAERRLVYRGNYNVSRYCEDRPTQYARLAIEGLLSHTAISMEPEASIAYGCTLPAEDLPNDSR